MLLSLRDQNGRSEISYSGLNGTDQANLMFCTLYLCRHSFNPFPSGTAAAPTDISEVDHGFALRFPKPSRCTDRVCCSVSPESFSFGVYFKVDSFGVMAVMHGSRNPCAGKPELAFRRIPYPPRGWLSDSGALCDNARPIQRAHYAPFR